MRSVSREVELKLELSDEAFQRIERRVTSKDPAAGEPRTRTLHSVYFDTRDHRLRAHGLSLRLRRKGADWLQTVKWGTGVRAGVSTPMEAQSLIEDFEPRIARIPDRTIRKRVRVAVGKAPLLPVFETMIERSVENVRSADGAEIEVAFDKGSVRADGLEKSLCELELELKSGAPDALVGVAQSLLASEPIRFASMSKAERGYALAAGSKPDEVAPIVASVPDIPAGELTSDAIRRVADCLVAQILGNWRVVLASDDPEGVHQLRIGLRRLRGTLKALRPVLEGEKPVSLAKGARDVAAAVGSLRDIDVLATELIASVARSSASPDLSGVRSALERARTRAREEARKELASPKWTHFQLSLAMLPQSFAPGGELAAAVPRKPVKPLIDKALARQWHRLAERGRRIGALGVTERHELRKELKTLRYTTELFASLYPRREVRKLVKNMRDLQDILGYLNDVSLAEKLASLEAEGKGGEVELQRAAGFVIGWHSAQAEMAWIGASEAWERLDATPRFWK